MTGIDWHLGDVVRTLRARKGWTQTQLGKHAGMNKATVISVEKMDRNHGRDTYEKIARAFGFTVTQLHTLIPTVGVGPVQPDVESEQVRRFRLLTTAEQQTLLDLEGELQKKRVGSRSLRQGGAVGRSQKTK